MEPLHVSEPEANPQSLANRLGHPLGTYIGRRVLAGIVTVFVASVLIFLAITVLPGNVIEIVLGKNATADRVAALTQQLNGGRPAWERYLRFLGNLVSGNLGYSTAGLVQGDETRLSSIVGPAVGHSAALAIITLILFVLMMLALGLFAGLKAGTARDSAISVTSLGISALPEFLIGTVLIEIFFDKLGWLPPISSIQSGNSVFSDPKALVLPIATLLLVSLAFGSRQLRASVAEIVSQDYVMTARINGYGETSIIRKYVLPNALAPSVQIIAQQMQYLIAGIIVVESVFNYPGIGRSLVNAISVQDTQEILVISTILATIYIAINVVADVVCVLLDPRVRTTI